MRYNGHMNIPQKECLQCRKVFTKPSTESKRLWEVRHKYCSKICANNAPRSAMTRLKMRAKKVGKPSWNKGKKLTSAHRKALRKKHKPLSKETKLRTELSNGRTLCLICHRVITKKFYIELKESNKKRKTQILPSV